MGGDALAQAVHGGGTLARARPGRTPHACGEARSMLRGFRDFLMRGNVVDLAVAVVIGAAFGGIVTAFATDLIGGLIAAAGGVPDFSKEGVKLGDATVIYGTTVTAIINFVIVAAVVYFVVVVPMQRMTDRFRGGEADVATPAPSDEAVLLTEIRDLLRTQER
jgi:large conductance mechanosensitive channel